MTGRLVLPQRFTTQPQYFAQIDTSNPLTRGLSYYFSGRPLPNDTVAGTKAVAVQSGIARGFGSTFGAGTTDSISTPLSTHATQRTYFILAYQNGPGGSGIGRLFEKRALSDGQVELLLYSSTTLTLQYERDWSGGNGVWNISGTGSNGPINLGISYDASSASNVPSIYLNGGVASTTTASSPSGSPKTNTSPYIIGNRTNDNARNWDGWVEVFFVWDRILSPSEHLAIALNPWQVFLAPPKQYYVSAPSSGTTVSPGTGHLVFAGYAPTVTFSGGQTISPGVGHLVFTGYAPTVTRSGGQTVSPGTGHLTFAGHAPVVSFSGGQTVSPGAGHLVFTGYVPTVSQGGQIVSPGTGHLSFTGYAPTVVQMSVPTIKAGGGVGLTSSGEVVCIFGSQPIGLRANGEMVAVMWVNGVLEAVCIDKSGKIIAVV